MWEWIQIRREAGVYKRFGVCILGDFIDPIGLSRFPKSARKHWDYGRLRDAIDECMPFLSWAAKTELGCTYLLGNHEQWVLDSLDTLPALEGLPGTAFGALTGLDQIEGLEILDVGDRILFNDNVVAMHGQELPKSPESVLRKFPYQFTIHGHDHRVYQIYRTHYDANGEPGTVGVASVGHLASNDAIDDYAPYADMQLGFGTIEFHGKRNNGHPFFSINPKVIVENGGRCVVC